MPRNEKPLLKFSVTVVTSILLVLYYSAGILVAR